MFDITQVRSALNNKSLKEDIEYIDDALDIAIYGEEFDGGIVIEVPGYKEEINLLKSKSHTHENMPILNRITNFMVDAWNAISPRKLSQLENDTKFITEEYVKDRISELTGEEYDKVILTSKCGNNFILNIDGNGVLVTTAIELDNPVVNKRIVLKSPSGNSFLLNVDDDGVINPIQML